MQHRNRFSSHLVGWRIACQFALAARRFIESQATKLAGGQLSDSRFSSHELPATLTDADKCSTALFLIRFVLFSLRLMNYDETQMSCDETSGGGGDAESEIEPGPESRHNIFGRIYGRARFHQTAINQTLNLFKRHESSLSVSGRRRAEQSVAQKTKRAVSSHLKVIKMKKAAEIYRVSFITASESARSEPRASNTCSRINQKRREADRPRSTSLIQTAERDFLTSLDPLASDLRELETRIKIIVCTLPATRLAAAHNRARIHRRCYCNASESRVVSARVE
jgi:hypothetical protein